MKINKTIVRIDKNKTGVVFGNGTVLLSFADGETPDGEYFCTLHMSALTEPEKIGEKLSKYNGKSIDDLENDGVVFPEGVSLHFSNIEGLDSLQECLFEVRKRLYAHSKKETENNKSKKGE